MKALTASDREQIEEILSFWFGEVEGIDDTDQTKMRLWWQGHPEDDEAIKQRFASTVEDALEGKLNHWCGEPRGSLALILTLDQFTRVLGRGTSHAFAGDSAAQKHCLEAIEQGLDEQLRFCERSFLYMPLMHAENKELAQRSLDVFQKLEESRAAHRGEEAQGNSHAKQHADIVLRFGRYPHRNELLGRESTPEEEAFMEDGGPSFGQKKK